LRFIRHIYEREFLSEGDIILYTMLFMIGFGEAAATPFYWIYSLPLQLLPVLALFYWVRKRPLVVTDLSAQALQVDTRWRR
jgi:hypothetical protein